MVCLWPRNGRLLPASIAPLSLVKTKIVLSRQPEFVELGQNGGDILVHRMEHRCVDVLFFVGRLLAGGGKLGGLLRIDGRQIVLLRLQRRVGDVERHVAEERLVLALANELDGTLRDQIVGVAFVLRAELGIVPPRNRTAPFDGAAIEVVRAAAVINPRFVEAVRIRAVATCEGLVGHVFEGLGEGRAEFRRVRIVAVVPFAEDAGAIAVGLEAFGDGRFLHLQFAANLRACADADRMSPGQQHRARRRTNAPAHELCQLDAL